MSSIHPPLPLGPRLPALSPDRARSATMAYDRRLAQRLARLQGRPSLHAVRSAPAAPLLRLQLDGDSGPLEVVFTAPDHVSLNLLASDDLPAEWIGAALDLVFAPLLQALRALGLPVTRVARLSRCPAGPAAGSAWCRLRFEGSDLAVFALPTMSPAVLAVLSRARAGAAPGIAAGDLALRGAVELSRRTLSQRVLRGLSAGDVLLLAHGDEQADMPRRVRFGVPGDRCWIAEVHVEDLTVTLTGEPIVTDDDIDEPLEAEGVPAGLEDLAAPVRFEIDTQAVRLADLSGYAPGSVITLASPLSSATVRLVACGQRIGTAELVAVGEHLGARILRIGLDHAE